MAASGQKVVAVFGSYRPTPGAPEYELGCEVGRLVARAGWTVINGGYGGIMEASARGAKERDGRVIGVTMESFSPQANPFTDETVCAANLWERLRTLINRADAFIALPGATGTLAEVAVAWELMSKRLMPPKPLVFLGEFWRPLHNMMVTGPRAKAACGGLVRIETRPKEAVDFLATILKQ